MLGFESHDHKACIAGAIAEADRYCHDEGLRMTPTRRRVLEILLERHSALGAYDILEQLSKEGLGAQPPVAYRALDFLVKHGFAHKIERLNAFVACAHVGQDHTPAFLICRGCDAVAEAHATSDREALAKEAASAGFQVERVVIEAVGLCPNCEGDSV